MLGAMHAAILSSVLHMIGWLIVGFAALHLVILIHELSHLFAAGALRFSLWKIQVGTGPTLWRHAFGIGLVAEWRLWPGGGFVSAQPRGDTRPRLRQLLFVGAGPVSNFLLLVGVFCLIKMEFGSVFAAFRAGPGGVLLGALLWCVIGSTITGLLPITVTIGKMTLWSDGYLLLRLCAGPAGENPSLNVGYDPSEALKLLLNGPAWKEVPDASAAEVSCEQPFGAKISELEQLRARLASPLLPRQRRSGD